MGHALDTSWSSGNIRRFPAKTLHELFSKVVPSNPMVGGDNLQGDHGGQTHKRHSRMIQRSAEAAIQVFEVVINGNGLLCCHLSGVARSKITIDRLGGDFQVVFNPLG